jgi:DNA (cytosine-5)-methyltransferase 1
VSRPDRRLVGVDLFCGVGGMSLGFEQAGFDVVAAFDNDPVHLGVYSYNFPRTETICADIQEVQAESIETAVQNGWNSFGRQGRWNGVIDCIFGGPSCQGFSFIGSHDLDDARNKLIFEFARLVSEIRPRSFVLENVPGLLSQPYRETFARLVRKLRKSGYSISESRLSALDAADYGVPQWRKRVLLVGVQPDAPPSTEPTKVDGGPTARDALRGLPNADNWQSLLETDLHRLTNHQMSEMEHRSSEYGLSLRRRFGFEYARPWDRLALSGCQRTQHSPSVRRRFARLAYGGEDTPSRFRRLDPDGKSFALRAGSGRDHGSFTAPRPVHYTYPRVITVREAARLHSFPDWFRFHSTKWHAHREIGNSVPPRLGYAVASMIASVLDGPTCSPQRIPMAGDEKLLSMSLTEAADHFGFDREFLPLDVRRARSV